MLVSGGADYTGKPRPAVVVRSELFDAGAGITICPTTSTERDAELFRLRIEPTPENGLHRVSWVMIEKISTVAKRKLGPPVGQVESATMRALGEALAIYLGIGERSST